jgi:hypothetical protein
MFLQIIRIVKLPQTKRTIYSFDSCDDGEEAAE